MRYEIETTDLFDKWLMKLKDKTSRARIINRLDHIQLGNFGDHKNLGGNLFELRFFFGSGFRIYYTIKNKQVVILISGGNKSSQSKNIDKARDILADME
ncbi:MAG: type II toxin-antitoxin system RelE/ParE family toxin [Planctomycetota bacterium]|jgi:putative addiction module killer protein